MKGHIQPQNFIWPPLVKRETIAREVPILIETRAQEEIQLT
jgi:hypothetical protein